MEGAGPHNILGQNLVILGARRSGTRQRLSPHARHCHSSQHCPTAPLFPPPPHGIGMRHQHSASLPLWGTFHAALVL